MALIQNMQQLLKLNFKNKHANNTLLTGTLNLLIASGMSLLKHFQAMELPSQKASTGLSTISKKTWP